MPQRPPPDANLAEVAVRRAIAGTARLGPARGMILKEACFAIREMRPLAAGPSARGEPYEFGVARTLDDRVACQARACE